MMHHPVLFSHVRMLGVELPNVVSYTEPDQLR